MVYGITALGHNLTDALKGLTVTVVADFTSEIQQGFLLSLLAVE